MRKYAEFTLAKGIRTVKGELRLTSTQDSGAGGPVVYNLDKFGEGSRLENWRKLMVPGREIRIYEEARDDGPHPVIALLRLRDDDTLEWDNQPSIGYKEWVPFWDEHRYLIELEAWNKKQEEAIAPDEKIEYSDNMMSF